MQECIFFYILMNVNIMTTMKWRRSPVPPEGDLNWSWTNATIGNLSGKHGGSRISFCKYNFDSFPNKCKLSYRLQKRLWTLKWGLIIWKHKMRSLGCTSMRLISQYFVWVIQCKIAVQCQIKNKIEDIKPSIYSNVSCKDKEEIGFNWM